MGFIGCTTIDRDGHQKANLPTAFMTEQIITFRHKGLVKSLLSQLKYDGTVTTLIFLDPTFSTPLVQIKQKNGNVIEKWYIEKIDIPVFQIIQSIETIYNLGQIESDRLYPLANGKFIILELNNYDGCLFPKLLSLTFKNSYKVTITTTSVRCY